MLAAESMTVADMVAGGVVGGSAEVDPADNRLEILVDLRWEDGHSLKVAALAESIENGSDL